MYNQDTIKMLHKLWRETNDSWYEKVYNMAIFAFEKQIPKKPNMDQNKYNENLWYLHCPSCGNYIGMWNSRLKHSDIYKYNNTNKNICQYCGQAIDLEEE